ncbi:hypothetical protein GS501_02860 [Saccharibacter sp. 17.LH.SD]|uniref:hypothetical protein n=1 Tax=Saccharibacter sp. 17.LH.SD TaxID=2689393 RepID=UPI00136A786B|nr:hypothetical protein [Saccharibacter sp. 17.LH.SD]MXV43994.1 hypothetical protein [Saccharibacter sp. 17.LH.SD]
MPQSITLNPKIFPKLDIVSLAQTGKILRAERTTTKNGIPAFITREGWNELILHHARDGEPLSLTTQKILPALEQSVARLLGEAAQASTERPASLYTLETDLFPSNTQTRLALVCDQTHHVACALIGTPKHLQHLLHGASDRATH